jgi:hypothetical protein
MSANVVYVGMHVFSQEFETSLKNIFIIFFISNTMTWITQGVSV